MCGCYALDVGPRELRTKNKDLRRVMDGQKKNGEQSPVTMPSHQVGPNPAEGAPTIRHPHRRPSGSLRELADAGTVGPVVVERNSLERTPHPRVLAPGRDA
jgi:hypothetical protein